jgi:hypothetical protein
MEKFGSGINIPSIRDKHTGSATRCKTMNICKKSYWKTAKNPGIPRRKQGKVCCRNLRNTKLKIQYCGSGSRIRCLFDPWIPDPVWVKTKIRIWDEPPGLYFREPRNNFLG